MEADQLEKEVAHQKVLCHAAGCTEGFVTKTDLVECVKALKPSIFVSIMQVALPIILVIGPAILVFYGKFSVLESQMKLVMEAFGIVVKVK
jgi:hypothetical protein